MNLSACRSGLESQGGHVETERGPMALSLSVTTVLAFLLLLLFVAVPSTEAASVVETVERAKFQPESLTPAVWRAAAKQVAKKVGKAITQFAIYEAAEKAVVSAYDKASKWIKRRFNR
ncbi:hypothetical protein EGR_06726 [Echinococcus granulosus]|uniref:Uncharacterized protein n=1 Tax=Echinococcus granulosus TaxID=6210 RepID=W6UY10_ECHGR|nr:hypothetical protein EGR_06726 [Echinococcus granulosus]EUB58439.1 hypothetical protein EGR_06726 [Echinococcus granulosus]